MTGFAGNRNDKNEKNLCERRIVSSIRAAILVTAILITSTGAVHAQQAQAAVSPSSASYSSSSSPQSSSSCNCVVFRLDDIQDFWLHDVQLATLDTFSDSDTKVTPGLIMNFYGRDEPIVAKIEQGKDAGVYELALHGWNHVDYAKLPLGEQEQTLVDANTKLEALHGSKSNIFITPYNSLNENTLVAMKDIGLEIVSADTDPDNGFLAPTYPALSSSSSSNSTHGIIKSIPMTVTFMDRHKPVGSNGKTLTQLKGEIDASVASHGWAVIMLHPQDFAIYKDDNDSSNSSSGKRIAQDAVNSTQIEVLKSLIKQLATDGRTITSFNGVVQFLGENTQASVAAAPAAIAVSAEPPVLDTPRQVGTGSTTSEHITFSDRVVTILKPAVAIATASLTTGNGIINNLSRSTLATHAPASDSGDEITYADEAHIKGEDTPSQAGNPASPGDRDLWSIMQSLLSGLTSLIVHMFDR
jgi:peptidoglycan/xylan/chitin deacetylase (PgdA/CDA1 family)